MAYLQLNKLWKFQNNSWNNISRWITCMSIQRSSFHPISFHPISFALSSSLVTYVTSPKEDINYIIGTYFGIVQSLINVLWWADQRCPSQKKGKKNWTLRAPPTTNYIMLNTWLIILKFILTCNIIFSKAFGLHFEIYIIFLASE
jgi:hypothetical protein